MIAKGEFLAEVLGAELTTSPNSGAEQVAVTSRFLEGPNDGDCITDYRSLTDAALPYTVKDLRTYGWTGDDICDLSMLAGHKVRLKVVHEEYQGKTRAKVKFVDKYRERPQLGDEARRGIADRLRLKIAAIDAATGNGAAPSGPPGPNPPPHGATDDIPF